MPSYRSIEPTGGGGESIDLHPRAVASESQSQSGFNRPDFNNTNSFFRKFCPTANNNNNNNNNSDGSNNRFHTFANTYARDIISGVTAGVMMLPQGLAYASLANLPDVWGLYPGVIPAFIYSAIGPCKQASVGPEALKSQLVGMVVMGLGDTATLQDKIDEVLVLSFMFGMILFVLGLLRLGYVEALLSKAVVNGFIFAVAIEIAIEQLPSMLRIHPPHSTDGSFYRFIGIIKEAGSSEVQSASLVFSILSLAFLWGLAYFKRKSSKRFTWLVYIPDVLVLVLLAVFIQWAGNFDVDTLGLVSAPPSEDVDGLWGLFVFKYPRITTDRLARLLPTALIISLISYVESMVVAKKYSNKHRYRVSSNKEMLALGLCNVVGCFFGSYGAQGSLPRSVVQDATGAKSNVALFASATLVSLSIAFLLPVFQTLPRPCMGAVVFVAACSLMEIEILLFFWRMRAFKDLFLWGFVLCVTLFFGIPFGIVTALVVSLMQVLKQTSFPSVRVLGRSCDNPDLFIDLRGATKHEDGTYSGSPVVPLLNVHILKLEGPVFFANIARLVEVLQRVHARAPKTNSETLPLLHGESDIMNGGSGSGLPAGASLLDSQSPSQSSQNFSPRSILPRPYIRDDGRSDENPQDSLVFGVLPDEECSITSIILDLSCVTRLDATALWYLTSSIHDCHRLGQRMLLVYGDDEMLVTLSRAGIVRLCGENSMHTSIASAARALNAPVQIFSPPPAGRLNLRKKMLNTWRFVFG